MERYSIIHDKNPREIVLLRGRGCRWKRCAFCDYHTDSSDNLHENYEINKAALSRVTGIYGCLEVINSGSFIELDPATIDEIIRTSQKANIKMIHFESHWMYKDVIPAFRARFNKAGINVIFKIGVETFDKDFRENILHKGMGDVSPLEITAAGFGEINLLFGIEGQSEDSMKRDIETGLKYFTRVCVNIMTPCTARLQPSESVIDEFMRKIYPIYKDDARIDILLQNTDFGVGVTQHE